MKLRIVFPLILFVLLGCENDSGLIRFDKQSEYERVLVVDKGDRR